MQKKKKKNGSHTINLKRELGVLINYFYFKNNNFNFVYLKQCYIQNLLMLLKLWFFFSFFVKEIRKRHSMLSENKLKSYYIKFALECVQKNAFLN